MNIGKLKGPEKMLQIAGKLKLQECKSRVLLYVSVCMHVLNFIQHCFQEFLWERTFLSRIEKN
jgi:hypothetical protein